MTDDHRHSAALTPEQWARVEALFDKYVDRDARRALLAAELDAELADEPEIRRHVERLLDGDEKSLPFLETGAADFAAPILADVPAPAARVGPWQLLRELGRGGMGVVYLAERADGAFEQTVAVKLVKRGMDSEAVLARFRNERQVLASLRHPYIARLLDGGVTDDGTPWFAMEYVDGEPITTYCDSRALPLDERLALCEKVCRAVGYAHNLLVIHRDLKPSNILVTADGNPQLLDFGLAKVLDESAGDATAAATAAGQRWLTLDYASPEQVRGAPVGTPSDTYQMGLILYELATGRRAYSVGGLSAAEAEAVICEVDPPRPAARSVPDDVATIIMKALSKDPMRRYASADALADELVRRRRGLPIRARPDTVTYRTTKFVRRHWRGVAAAATILALLVAYAVTVTVQSGRVQAERDEARHQAARAEEVIDYLTGLFEANDPSIAQGDTITVREVLRRGVERAENLADYPDLQATLFRVTADIHASMGDLDQAEVLYRRALGDGAGVNASAGDIAGDVASDIAGEVVSDIAVPSMLGLARTLMQQSRYEEAEPLLLRVLRAPATRRDASLLQGVLFDHYSVLHAIGDEERADSAFGAWSDVARRSEIDAGTAGRMIRLGQMLGYRGQMRGDTTSLRRAQEFVRRGVMTLRLTRGPRHPSVASAYNELAQILITEATLVPADEATPAVARAQARALADADSITSESVRLHESIYPEPAVGTWLALQHRAEVLRLRGDLAGAESAVRRAVELAEAVAGSESQSMTTSRNLLGRILMARGNHVEAEVELRWVRDWWIREHGADYLYALTASVGHGGALLRLGRYGEAEAELTRAHEALLRQRGADDRFTRDAAWWRGQVEIRASNR